MKLKVKIIYLMTLSLLWGVVNVPTSHAGPLDPRFIRALKMVGYGSMALSAYDLYTHREEYRRIAESMREHQVTKIEDEDIARGQSQIDKVRPFYDPDHAKRCRERIGHDEYPDIDLWLITKRDIFSLASKLRNAAAKVIEMMGTWNDSAIEIKEMKITFYAKSPNGHVAQYSINQDGKVERTGKHEKVIVKLPHVQGSMSFEFKAKNGNFDPKEVWKEAIWFQEAMNSYMSGGRIIPPPPGIKEAEWRTKFDRTNIFGRRFEMLYQESLVHPFRTFQLGYYFAPTGIVPGLPDYFDIGVGAGVTKRVTYNPEAPNPEGIFSKSWIKVGGAQIGLDAAITAHRRPMTPEEKMERDFYRSASLSMPE